MSTFRERPIIQVAWNDPTQSTLPAQYSFFTAEDVYRQYRSYFPRGASWADRHFVITPYIDSSSSTDFLYDTPMPGAWYCESMRCMFLTGRVLDADNTLHSEYTFPAGRKNEDGGTTGSNSKYIWRVYSDPAGAATPVTSGNYFFEGYGQNRKVDEDRVICYGNSNPDTSGLDMVDHVKSAFTSGYEWKKDDCFAFRFYKYAAPVGWDTDTYPPRFVVALPSSTLGTRVWWIDVLEGRHIQLWKYSEEFDYSTYPPTSLGIQRKVVASAVLPVSQWERATGEMQFCVFWANKRNSTPERGYDYSTELYKTIVITSDPYIPPEQPQEVLAYSDNDLDLLIDDSLPFGVYGIGGSYYFSYHPIQFSYSTSIWTPWTRLNAVPDAGDEPEIETIYRTNPEGINAATNTVGGWSTATGTKITGYSPKSPDGGETYSRTDVDGSPYVFRFKVTMTPSIEQQSPSTPERRYRTPALFGFDTLNEPTKRLTYAAGSTPSIDAGEVVALSGSDEFGPGSVTQLDTITFRNRDGRWNNFDGAHGIRVDVNWLMSDGTTLKDKDGNDAPQPDDGGDPNRFYFRRFTGFVWSPVFSRSAGGEAVVTLSGVGWDQILEDEICIGTPIYDGRCALWVIWDLARRAGMSNDQVLLYQDPRSPGTSFRVLDLVTLSDNYSPPIDIGESDAVKEIAFKSVCGSGLCNHYILKYGVWQGEPAWYFEDGLPIKEAISKIAEDMGAWWFINNYGNLCFLTIPEFGGSNSRHINSDPYGVVQKTFKEIPDVDESDSALGYNELRRNLNVQVPMEHRRNSYYVEGLDLIDYYASFGMVQPRPLVAKWIPDLTTQSYQKIPWHRWVIKTDPNFFTEQQVNNYFSWLTSVGSRKRLPVSFSGWLHPDLYWLDAIYVQESYYDPGSSGVGMTPIGTVDYSGLSDPWPVNAVKILIESFSWSVDFESIDADMNIEGEVLWPGSELLWTPFI